MSYGVYSEVYLAVQWDWKNNACLCTRYDLANGYGIKVGETVNCRQRQRTLDFKIIDWQEVGGEKQDRLFIEAYLRKKVSLVFGLSYYNGMDCFWFKDYKSIKYCQEHFKMWVKEAKEILKNL